MDRPTFLRHWTEIQDPDNSHYRGDDELLSIGSPFGRKLGLTRIGVHHELLPPGRRTSYPHAESDEDEFIYVLEGTPDVWIDGHIHRMREGEGVAFPAGTGIAHTFLNNTDSDVRLLVVGEASKASNKLLYPLHPHRAEILGERHWHDAPRRQLGPHDGLPDKRRGS